MCTTIVQTNISQTKILRVEFSPRCVGSGPGRRRRRLALLPGELVPGTWGLKIICLKPLTHINFRCEVPTPSVLRVNDMLLFKPHILKHHIPELPTNF